MNSQHVAKLVKTSMGFGVWNHEEKKKTEFQCTECDYKTKRNFDLKRHTTRVHLKPKPDSKDKLLSRDKCDYTSKLPSNIKRQMKEVKHTKPVSRATQYRKLNSLKDELNCRILRKESPQKVFGEKEVTKLIEDCGGSTNNLLNMIKWMRACFGKKSFAPTLESL